MGFMAIDSPGEESVGHKIRTWRKITGGTACEIKDHSPIPNIFPELAIMVSQMMDG